MSLSKPDSVVAASDQADSPGPLGLPAGVGSRGGVGHGGVGHGGVGHDGLGHDGPGHGGMGQGGRALDGLLGSADPRWTRPVREAVAATGGIVQTVSARAAVARLASTGTRLSHILVDRNGAEGLLETLAELASDIASADVTLLVLGAAIASPTGPPTGPTSAASSSAAAVSSGTGSGRSGPG